MWVLSYQFYLVGFLVHIPVWFAPSLETEGKSKQASTLTETFIQIVILAPI